MREMRDKKDASKSRARFWEVAGSKMGNITGMYLCMVYVCMYIVMGVFMCVHMFLRVHVCSCL